MNTIYTQFEKAFNKVAVFVLINDKGEKLATIAFKFPRDGAGRLTCYFDIDGLSMVKGIAGGCGYDKKSAAFYDAAKKANNIKLDAEEQKYAHTIYGNLSDYIKTRRDARDLAAKIYSAVSEQGGLSFEKALSNRGLNLIQAL